MNILSFQVCHVSIMSTNKYYLLTESEVITGTSVSDLDRGVLT